MYFKQYNIYSNRTVYCGIDSLIQSSTRTDPCYPVFSLSLTTETFIYTLLLRRGIHDSPQCFCLFQEVLHCLVGEVWLRSDLLYESGVVGCDADSVERFFFVFFNGYLELSRFCLILCSCSRRVFSSLTGLGMKPTSQPSFTRRPIHQSLLYFCIQTGITVSSTCVHSKHATDLLPKFLLILRINGLYL